MELRREGRSLFLAQVESLSEAEKWARGQPEEVVLALAEAIADLDIVNVSAKSGRYSLKRMALRGRRSACSLLGRHLFRHLFRQAPTPRGQGEVLHDNLYPGMSRSGEDMVCTALLY